jgi:hypothetical protein
MIYYLPILLQNKNIKLLIDENIKIRKITQEERVNFFGIEKIDFGFKNNQVFINSINRSKKDNGRYGYTTFHIKHIMDGASSIFASNYIVECSVKDIKETNEIIKNLDIAFNVSKPTNTRCSIGFKSGDSGVNFFDGYSYKEIPVGFLNFNKRDLVDFPVIYKKLKNLDQKERLKFELFMNGLHSQTSLDLRFLSLVMAFENMFLPEIKQELRFRFSLRIAEIVGSKISKKDKKGVFDMAKDLYDIRSDLIHNGYSKKLTRMIYAEAVRLLWVSLVEYMNYPQKFQNFKNRML